MDELVKIDRDRLVAVVTLNVPNKRNALSVPLVRALEAAIRETMADTRLRAVVLQGDGGHFCAGGDLGGLDASPFDVRAGMQLGHRMIRQLVEGRLPVVAAVEGNAYGAGFSIAMACDHVVGDSRTTFSAAFGRVGLMPDYGLMWTLPQRIGMAAARELFLFCEPVRGEKAHQMKVIDRLVEDGGVRACALALAHRLAEAPPGSLMMTKAALARAPQSLDAMLAWEADTQTLLVGSRDFKEAASAFIEKRPPRFTGQ